MSDALDASEADRQEQEQPVLPGEDAQIPPLEPEVPPEDALEQHLPVPGDDDEYDRA